MTLSKTHDELPVLPAPRLARLVRRSARGGGNRSYYMEGMYVEYQLAGSTTWRPVTGTWVNGPTKTIDEERHRHGRHAERRTAPTRAPRSVATAAAGRPAGSTICRPRWEGQDGQVPLPSPDRRLTTGTTSSYGEFLDNVSVNDLRQGAARSRPRVHVAGYHGSATMAWGTASANGGSAITSYARLHRGQRSHRFRRHDGFGVRPLARLHRPGERSRLRLRGPGREQRRAVQPVRHGLASGYEFDADGDPDQHHVGYIGHADRRLDQG